MKTLSLFLLLPLSFLPSAPLSAQVNCIIYFGGETSCDGPRGYHAEGRQFVGGIASWYDNRGNTATVHSYPLGVTSIDATGPAIGPYGPTFPSSVPFRSWVKDARDADKEATLLSPVAPPPASYDYSALPPDRSKLPRTPEEYTLSFLRMKAIEEKDFEKADELEQLLFAEQFKNASPAGRVHIFKKAKEERLTEHSASSDRLEKRFRTEYKGSSSEADKRIRKFKEMSWKAFRDQETKFDELLEELVRRQKVAAREASLKAELQSLQTLIASGASEAEVEKKTEELAAKWKAEDEREMAILDERLNRLIDEKVNRARPVTTQISAQPK